jgi:phosphoglycerate dehydrogenase-like enzyme
MRVVLAVHDPPVWVLPDREVERIVAALPGDDVRVAQTAEARREAFPDAEVIVTTKLAAGDLALAGAVRWIHSTAVGVGALLVPDLVARPIVVTNSKGVHREAIAEHAIALALALRRSLHLVVLRQAERRWAQEELLLRRVRGLGSSELLVVGLGAIGSEVARLGAGLGMRVVGIRRRLSEPAPAGVSRVRPPEDLPDALRTADVVVLALPRTAETQALIGEPELAGMKPTAVLVNVARGRLIDQDALERALRAGRLGGVALDAFPREPLDPASPLWMLPNVIVSPHVAPFGDDYWAPAVDLFLDNMQRFRRGDSLRNVVDKDAGY